jgi:hypothetical protein
VNNEVNKTFIVGIIVDWVVTAAIMILACSIWLLVGLSYKIYTIKKAATKYQNKSVKYSIE